MTITNANFDKERFFAQIKKALVLRDELNVPSLEKGVELGELADALIFTVNSNDEIVFKSVSKKVGVLAIENEDLEI